MKSYFDRAILKRIIDLLMTIALLSLMAFQVTGQKTHEWIGTAMIMLFVVHNILNINWYKKLFIGKYRPVRIIQTVINALVCASMIGLMISGIIMSGYVFNVLNITGGMMTARLMHLSCSYWGFVLMSMHLGLHWGMVIRPITNILKNEKAKKLARIIFRCMAVIIAGYGVWIFYDSHIWSYMTLRNQFAFFDYEKSVIAVFRDNLAMMGCFVFVSYYVMKLLQKQNRVKMKEGTRK